MKTPRIRQYRFATPAQWRSGLRHRFALDRDGAPQAIARLDRQALRVTSGQRAEVIAIGPEGAVFWRAREIGAAAGAVFVQSTLHASSLGARFEPTGDLAVSPRWAIDRDGIWAFAAATARLARTLRRTLHVDHDIDVAGSVEAALDRELAAVQMLDIAGDALCGVWVLLRISSRPDADGADMLAHFDENGCCIRTLAVPGSYGAAQQIAVVARGDMLVVLAGEGRFLLFINAETGACDRLVTLGKLAMCWTADRLAADGRDRIVLAGRARQRDDPVPLALSDQIHVLDGRGDSIDGPLAVDAAITDLAVHGDRVWVAAGDGVRVFGTGMGGGAARESESLFMTPLLLSPESDRGRGWLRAEVTIDLPAQAVLVVRFAGTDDQGDARRIGAIFDDANRDALERAEAIWAEFEKAALHKYTFQGPHSASTPIAIPIFEVEQRWMVLDIRVVTPPGVAAPALRALTVRYPDVTIGENLPAIFRGRENDPGGVMRRLTGVIESTTQRIDERIANMGASLDPARASPALLDYISGWLGVPWDDGLDEAVRRDLLRHAPSITEHRGTRAGLVELLLVLLGGRGSVRIVDLTVDHAVLRLGGGACKGEPLPALLAGTRRCVATLGGKAVLGRARLSCDGGQADALDPLAVIVPTLRIDITTDRKTHATLVRMLDGLLRQFVPAGVGWVVRWHFGPLSADSDDGVLVLDADGPAVLGTDSRMGHATIGGSAGLVLQ